MFLYNANMALLARFSQINLLLPLPVTRFLLICRAGVAAGAAHAVFEQRRGFGGFSQRVTARPAQRQITLHQPVADGYAFIKHKALTLPATSRLGYGFQVFQNAALQVVYLAKAFGL